MTLDEIIAEVLNASVMFEYEWLCESDHWVGVNVGNGFNSSLLGVTA